MGSYVSLTVQELYNQKWVVPQFGTDHKPTKDSQPSDDSDSQNKSYY